MKQLNLDANHRQIEIEQLADQYFHVLEENYFELTVAEIVIVEYPV
jgi:hypothetical protein